jgi:cell division septation protein DedD
MSDPQRPTIDELLAIMHADERQFWESGNGKPQQREEFLEGIKERWRKTPVRKIPFANPTDEYLRRERITRAIQSGQRPDPEDLAEEAADDIRYKQKVAEAFDKKFAVEIADRKLKDVHGTKLPDPPPPSAPLESGEPPSGDRTISSTSSPSFRAKLGHLADSNLTWGAVGMIIAGIGAYLGVSLLVVGGWFFLTIATWRTNFFEGKTKKVQWIGNVLVSISIAVLLFLIMAILPSKTPQEKSSIIQPQTTQTPPPVIPSPTVTQTTAPSSSSMTTPSVTAKPSPPPKFRSKRPNVSQPTGIPCSAEDRLLGKC